MKDITKKVVILNNFSSPYISEAIIVLKNYDPRLEGKVIDEAERLVSDYIQKNHSKYMKEHIGTREYICQNNKKERRRSSARSSKPRITAGIIFIVLALLAIGIYNFIIN